MSNLSGIEKLEPTWCKHYCSPTCNDECKAGITFDSLHGIEFDRRPCFWKNRDRCSPCEKQEWPTQEDLQEVEKSIKMSIDRFAKVLPLITEIKKTHEGKNWNETKPCPVCKGVLTIRHAGYNGHCSARCQTDDCINFQE